jgi:hypothetical protein
MDRDDATLEAGNPSIASMSNAIVTTIPWIAFAVHLVVGSVAYRRTSAAVPLALLNLATAACVLAYWVPRWHGYLARGVTWYGSDQLVPLYAALVCTIAALALTGRFVSAPPQWVLFGIDATALLGAALFFSFFRITRLM